MTTIEYLNSVLAEQTLADDSIEMKELQTHRAEVEALIRAEFAGASPTIRYGGSRAKRTLIRESYDLDIVCYFPNGENGAGATLEEIFENVGVALGKQYSVSPKTSALRLRSNDMSRRDFHIDVVPGRFTDDTKSDCFLFQNGASLCIFGLFFSTVCCFVRSLCFARFVPFYRYAVTAMRPPLDIGGAMRHHQESQRPQ